MIPRYSLPQMTSIWQDENKFRIMLQIELLVCQAHSKLGLVPAEAVERICKKARFSVKRIQEIEKKTQHDIVAFVTDVANSLGKDAQYLHIGLTSSDLLDTTLNVQLVQASDILLEDLKKLSNVLAKKARQYRDTVCIGRTHGVHAEPTTFGLKLALWYDEIKRHIERLKRAKEEVCCGKLSGAVGTYSNIDPKVEIYVCKKLGLRPVNIATQVIQRDIYAYYLSTLAGIGASLEKFAQEIRHLQRTEVLEVEEPFAKGQKGSSAMPHKRNPVICERICGLSRILRANALTAFENIALWHERDISHSSVERITLPDSTIVLDYMLHKCIEVIEGLIVYPQNMAANLIKTKGLIFSQRVLIALMEKGLSRPAAYDIVQRCAMKTWQGQGDFRTNLLADPVFARYITAEQLDKLMDLNFYLRHVKTIFRKVGL
ncbi:MAG: adenylosuccinate lyase [Candidatus Omnitrophica bacterium]|nr:adenylosuccinate lyase [Candidatus Omnitrophota bacterium]